MIEQLNYRIDNLEHKEHPKGSGFVNAKLINIYIAKRIFKKDEREGNKLLYR